MAPPLACYAASNATRSISVGSSASAFELLTRFDTGQRCRNSFRRSFRIPAPTSPLSHGANCSSVDQADVNADKLVTVDDPRVTRVGRFIRKTSLDELPQLFNVVFAGNLSLVGPRPHALQAKAADRLYDEAVDGYFARHRVKPGITGWAQIHGWRGETNSQEKIQQRVEHDLYYIENWSILLDIYILLRTPFALLRTENAY